MGATGSVEMLLNSFHFCQFETEENSIQRVGEKIGSKRVLEEGERLNNPHIFQVDLVSETKTKASVGTWTGSLRTPTRKIPPLSH